MAKFHWMKYSNFWLSRRKVVVSYGRRKGSGEKRKLASQYIYVWYSSQSFPLLPFSIWQVLTYFVSPLDAFYGHLYPYVVFYDRLLLGMMFSNFIFVACVSSLSFFNRMDYSCPAFVWIYHFLFTYSSVDEPLSYYK